MFSTIAGIFVLVLLGIMFVSFFALFWYTIFVAVQTIVEIHKELLK